MAMETLLHKFRSASGIMIEVKRNSCQSRPAKSLPEASTSCERMVCHREDIMEIKRSKNILSKHYELFYI